MNKRSSSQYWAQLFSFKTIVLICFLFSISFLHSQPLANGWDKFLGCSTGSSIRADFDNYWNQITPGNEGKWGWVEGSRNQYNWGGLDNIYQ